MASFFLMEIMFKHIFTGLLCLALGSAVAAPADPSDAAAEKLVASLHPQQGRIALPGNIATLELPATFRYLTPADTSALLQA